MNAEYFDKSIKSKRLEIQILKEKKSLFLYLFNDCDLFDKVAASIVNGGQLPKGLESSEREQINARLSKIKEMELNLYKFNFS